MLEDRLKEIIEEKLGIEPNNYSNDSRFIEDLGCDSLDVVDLIMDIEKEFNISIPDDDVNRLDTIGNLIEYVKERISVYPHRRKS